MKYVYLTFNWVFGILFLWEGLLCLGGSYHLIGTPYVVGPSWAGFFLIAAAALLLPPMRTFVYKKTNKKLPAKARAVLILVLFLAFGVFVGQEILQAREQTEKTAQLRQKNIDYFNANREQIISSVKRALSAKDYQSAISQSSKYLVSSDKELEQMNTQAKKAQKTEKLLAELKGVPIQNYWKNRKLYQQLLELHPDNERYKSKVAFYTEKIEKIKQKSIAAEVRRKKIESQFSGWNGSHRNLERIIKDSMNDPDSYEHVETVYWDRDDHLVVRTTFRGKNAFGGVVKDSVTAKVSLDGQVLQILDQ